LVPDGLRGFPSYTAGINCTYLSRLEKAANYPGLEIIAKLVTVLEVEPAELLRVAVARSPSAAVI
jgi:hypothetical protein